MCWADSLASWDRYPVRVVIRATADNPAVDMESPRRVISIAEEQSADYVVEDDLPYGAAVEAVRVDALLDAYVSTQGLDDREHVTTYVKRMTDRFGWYVHPRPRRCVARTCG